MSLFVPCLGVVGFSCHVCSGGSYSRSGCREGVCLLVLVQYHSKSNICTSFPYHQDDTGQCKMYNNCILNLFVYCLPFSLLGIIGHLCHVCPVGSKQHSRLKNRVRLVVSLQYTAFPPLYVTYADNKYGSGKLGYLTPNSSIASTCTYCCGIALAVHYSDILL
jgi:hypothetical protein